MRTAQLPALLALCMVGGCGALGLGGLPRSLRDLPWADNDHDQVVLLARAKADAAESRAAIDLLEQVLHAQPDHVDALRMRQDLLRQRGRRGVLLVEARAAASAAPGDGLRQYLLARIEEDPAVKLRGFERAAELAPDQLWPWLGLAHTLRGSDPERSLALYRDLYTATQHHPLVAVALAAALRDQDRPEEALAVYGELRGDRRVPGVGELGAAQVLSATDPTGAWAATLSALRLRPYDPGVRALVRGFLQGSVGPDQEAQVLDVLRERPGRMASFAQGDGAMLLADLLQRHGQAFAARTVLEQLVARDPTPAARQRLRRHLLAVGDIDAFLRRLDADVPPFVVDDEANQLRNRWLRLTRGPWRSAAPVDGSSAAALGEALRDVGWLVEVELLHAIVQQRWPEQAGAMTALVDEVRTELAFEAGLRRLLYQGYQERDTAELATVVARIRDLATRVLGRDVVGEPQYFTAPLVGEMLDPFRGAFAEHLARYNRHLVLGRRAGGVTEGLMVTRLSVAELPADEVLPLPGRCFEVVGIDRDVRSLSGVLGGDLAGVALLNHYLIDFDAVGDWALGVLARRRVAREDGLALLGDPLPVDVGNDPLDAAFRLSVASPVPDEQLPAAVLDTIRRHERRHLVDSFHYLPIESHLLSGLGLLVRHGLSAAGVEAEMERRAELASLATTPHTELALAHIVDFLADPSVRSPHHQGFGALAQQLSEELARQGVPRERCQPSRWHEVAPEQIRAAASAMLSELP